MPTARVVIFDNGPIEIDGPITIEDENGKITEVVEDEQVFLCRCGQSKEKPLCDGTHEACGFQHKYSA